MFGLKLRRWLAPPPAFHGISILDIQPATKSTEFFFEKTANALRLIAENDPRRFKTVANQIEIIINDKLSSFSAFYLRCGRVCLVDISKWSFKQHPEWSVKEYACTIVHEAIHGRLFQHMIPYTPITKNRIEKICIIESMRFAKKFSDDSFNWGLYFSKEIKKYGS